MILYVLNSEREIVDTIEIFKSLIWTTRYHATGDFELVLPATVRNFELLKNGKYIVRVDKPAECMVIKNLKLDTDIEDGDYLTVTGKDLSCLLEQRIVWDQTVAKNAPVEKFIMFDLVGSSLFQTHDKNRTVKDFNLGEYEESGARITAQFTGNNLAEVVQSICKTYGIGYRFRVDLDNNTFIFFDLYYGLDRTSSQEKNPRVIFSNEFDNLSKTSYSLNTNNFKNVAKVAGEGEGTARKTIEIGNAVGIDRHEIFVDARDISSNEGEIDEETYKNLLIERGFEKLAEHNILETIEGEVIHSYNYKFGEDYNLGDIVDVVNEYGITMSARITEVIECEDNTGIYVIPSFSTD